MAAERRPVGACRRRAQAQHGFGLVEVLVALLVFSIGLVGMIGLQARAAQFSSQAEDRARAAMLANDLVATMWTEGSTALDEATLAAWRERVADGSGRGLPGGEGELSEPDADGVVTITIEWTPPADAEHAVPSRYMTRVVLP